MISATVSPWFCFCWLYRASPSSAAKKYKQSDFDTDHLVKLMYRVVSCVVRRGCLPWPVHSLDKTLLAFALFHFVLQGQTCLFSRYLLISYFCIPIHYDENYFFKLFFFLVLILDGHVGLRRIFQLQLLQHWQLEHRLGLLWYWIVCLGSEHK